MTLEERLQGITPEERLQGIWLGKPTPEDIEQELQGMTFHVDSEEARDLVLAMELVGPNDIVLVKGEGK